LAELIGDPREKLPLHRPVPSGVTDPVLSYGRDHIVEVHHDAPLGIGGRDQLRGRNGALVLSGSSWLLRAEPFPGSPIWETIYFDLATGTMAERPSDNVAVFSKWAIHARQPEGAAPQLPPLFTYRAG